METLPTRFVLRALGAPRAPTINAGARGLELLKSMYGDGASSFGLFLLLLMAKSSMLPILI